jgi:precorrin-4/cobalt-precorrin-4 C11-methyltransferase
MTVHFVGAGPGAPDLLTLRAIRMLQTSAVCLYAGSLVPTEVLAHCPPGARLVDTALLTLDEIVAEFVAADAAGHDVARLCSGDPSVFSAVAEQARRLDAEGIAWDVTPGVPAFAAAAASLRRELTVPGVSQAVTLSRIARRATPMPDGQSLAELAASRPTLVLHLAVQAITEVVADLVPRYGERCPAAVVAYASRADELVVRAPLGELAEAVRAHGVERTAVIVVGEVLGTSGWDSHLYSAKRDRGEGSVTNV